MFASYVLPIRLAFKEKIRTLIITNNILITYGTIFTISIISKNSNPIHNTQEFNTGSYSS